MAFGYGIDRYGQSYFGARGGQIQCSILVLSRRLYDVLVGNVSLPIECFADVLIAGVPINNISSITIERGIENALGLSEIVFSTTSDNLPAIKENDVVQIIGGVRFETTTAKQQIFRGRLESLTPPSPGEIRAVIDAYDHGKTIGKESPGSVMQDDVAAWLAARISGLGLSDLQVVNRADPITISRELSLAGYNSILEAGRALSHAEAVHYLFLTGLGELVLLNPRSLATATPLFELTRQLDNKPLLRTQNRFNQAAISYYVGYGHDFVTYNLTMNDNGTSAIHAASLGTQPVLRDTYNDFDDQADYGVLPYSGGLQNNIPTTLSGLLAYAQSFCDESQRKKIRVEMPFNPFFDLGSVCLIGTDRYFAARIRHTINAESAWKSEWELWKA